MSKKNIGAVVSVIAASAAMATAYASTVTNLENDKQTNSLITEENKEVTTSNSFLKSDYTNEVKNTRIAGENRNSEQASKEVKEKVLIEKTANKIAEPQIEKAKDDIDKDLEETKDVVDYDIKDLFDVVAYDDKKIDESLKKAEEKEAIKKLVQYDDKAIEPENVVSYNNQELKEDAKVVTDKFVNTEYLNIRSSKDDSSRDNIVRTIKAGDKLVGHEEGEWFVSNEGYTNIKYLSNTYPQDLVDKVNKETAKKANDEKIAKLKAELETKKAQLANLKAEVEAKKAEETKKTEGVKKAEQAKAANQVQKVEANNNKPQANPTVYKAGWINTESLNVRDKAIDGKVLNSLAKGTWVEGNLANNGWLEVNLNGQKGYLNAAYLSDTEVSKEAAKKDVVKEAVQNAETVIEEESTSNKPAVNQNAQGAASVASQFAGHPYVWGSSDPNVGFDCSGLTSYAYRQVGVTIPHSSQAQFNNGYSVDVNNLQAGDLVFFSFSGGGIDHVGIVTSSDGTFVHASTPETGVRFDNIFNGSYQRSYKGARRIF